jgi:hypothetical protein
MELIDVMHMIGQQGQKASQPTDMVLGTVSNTSPLEIRINNTTAPLRNQVLMLTSNVIEYKIPYSIRNRDIVCYENGTALPVDQQWITLNRSLEVGDKVIMLKVNSGQKYIVLSRLFMGV